MNQEKIGKLIKEIRKKNNLTQKDLAEKYNVTYQAVSKWENGKNIPDVSLLKQMSKDFDINIEDILEGNFKKTTRKLNVKRVIIAVLFLILLLGVIIFLLIKNTNHFSFKTLSSKCASFNITGSIAYNSKKSSIYISDIEYCDDDDNEEYKNIECTLYEKEGKTETEIAKYSYNEKTPIKLEKYLKSLNININDYESKCKNYKKDTLYLKIQTKDNEGHIKIHKVPLSLNENC